MSTVSDRIPRLSVVLPLVDDRGWAVQAVMSWARQRVAKRSYEIVVVSDDPMRKIESDVRRVKHPALRIVHARSQNEAVLYNAGARAARADLVLFTESHVVASPDVVARVLDYFDDPTHDSVILGSGHISETPMARIDQELFEREAGIMESLGPWRSVGLRGFGIRSSIFRELGPIPERYGRFGELVLALRMHRAGRNISFLNEAVVHHVNVRTLGQLTPHLVAGFLGEGRFWIDEPELAAESFGGAPPWERFLAADPSSALLACLALLRSAWRDLGKSSWRDKFSGCLRMLPYYLGCALFHRRATAWLTNMKAVLASWRFLVSLRSHGMSASGNDDELLQRYVAVREAYARCGSVKALQELPMSQVQRITACKIRTVGLENCSLTGFFPVEVWDSQPYHWSWPTAVIGFRATPADYWLRLDIHASPPLENRCPRFELNGRVVPDDSVRFKEGCIDIDLPRPFWRDSGRQHLVLTCTPFLPRGSGLPDPRALGVTLFAIELEPLAATMVQNPENAAAA